MTATSAEDLRRELSHRLQCNLPLDEEIADDVARAILRDSLDPVLAHFTTLAATNAALVRKLADANQALGEARGQLHASEAYGLVEAWKRKAEEAEAENAALRAALEPLAKLSAMNPPEGVALNEWLPIVTGARAAIKPLEATDADPR